MNKKVLMIVDDTYEDLEAWYPKIRLEEAGMTVIVSALEKRIYTGKHGLPITSDITFDRVKEKDYQGVIIPGGYAPDRLRRYENVLEIIRRFDRDKKLIAFICHGGWVPISANILKGKHATGFFSIKDDMINAGVIWRDLPLVIDGHLVSSRSPADLPQFCKGILKILN